MKQNQKEELKLRIVLRKPPAGVDFALSLGRGGDLSLIQTQRSSGKDLRFECAVALAPIDRSGPPDFRGPFVQGPRGQRFVYISIGQYAGQGDSPWARRLKVPMVGIEWEVLDRVLADAAWGLEASVPGTDSKGGPTCATVKPFEGWKVIGKEPYASGVY